MDSRVESVEAAKRSSKRTPNQSDSAVPASTAATSNASSLIAKLERARKELLDLSARNRLINSPRGKSRSKRLEIVDERSDDVFRILVRDRKAMSFVPVDEEQTPEESVETGIRREEVVEATVQNTLRFEEQSELEAQPDESSSIDADASKRNGDSRLPTQLDPEHLHSRLLNLFYDARTLEEEQGVSILYLALGFLKWYEADGSDVERYAPLLLIPVDIERHSVGGKFRIRLREEDVATNLSLQAKLLAEFGVKIPEVPDLEDLSPEEYFDSVAQAVENQKRWQVLRNDIVLSFFSFAKFLMYRDLDVENWPEHAALSGNSLLKALLQEGFSEEPLLCGEDDKIDPLIAPAQAFHVTDADSSQAIVIEEVRRGRHLVVQGPPGTGKSQTITNMIAAAVKEGKSVLFVAEKLAALQVVKARMDRIQLGELCLELHSHKSNKKTVLAELERTLNLGRPKEEGSKSLFETLLATRERLNRHVASMNSIVAPAGISPFDMLGRLVGLQERGVPPSDFELDKPELWTRGQVLEKERLLQDFQLSAKAIGRPESHVWRGVKLQSQLLPMDLKRLLDACGKIVPLIREVQETTTELARLLKVRESENVHLKSSQALAVLVQRILEAPELDRSSIDHEVWENQNDAIVKLVQEGQELGACRRQLDGIAADVAWDTDLRPARRALAARGQTWFRWLFRDYRDAVATLRGVLLSDFPKAPNERLRIVDLLISRQTLARSLDQNPAASRIGSEAFGSLWRGAQSNWSDLSAVVKWVRSCREARVTPQFRRMVARLEDPESCRPLLKRLHERLSTLPTQIQSVFDTLQLDSGEAFSCQSIEFIPFQALEQRLLDWGADPEALSKWLDYATRRLRLAREGLSALADRLHDGRIPIDVAVQQFRMFYYEALIRSVFESCPELAEFTRQSHEQQIDDFRQLDQDRIKLARQEVAKAHYDAIPRGGHGEIATVKTEIAKKKRHKPIRQLLKEAGSAIKAIKPVFMMSPISVAQFLEPGALTFDLLIIDEASQVSPVDALGAMIRAGQFVVVGDSKQLPPTRFFNNVVSSDVEETEPAEGAAVESMESVLGLCVSQGMAERMLRWHYRSRHHSLIAVSNREFYKNRLYVVPSPTTMAAATGLRFRYIPEGLFDRGGTAANQIEARAIAEAVIEHARTTPKKSLGVGAFSVSQRDAIRDEIEMLLQSNTGLDEFFALGSAEPFFVKNLENIQGDERDVIFISVGYGKDSSGFMGMNFGPLSNEGGERRLNVLISRARERCEVFASFRADEIDLARAKTLGAAAFKTFLKFAETGVLDSPAPTNRDYDSEFEFQVAEALRKLGHDVHCQIGTAGFIIDLAVVDPDCPGRYLLGIECDGATYHSSRSARDRDRLRAQVLVDRGWRLHRVWSTDWFRRPNEELQRAHAAIEQARAELAAEDREAVKAAVAAREEVDEGALARISIDVTDPNDLPDWVVTYREASFTVHTQLTIPQTPTNQLIKIICSIVEHEGPVHEEEAARRVVVLWGQSKLGSKIREAIADATDVAVNRGYLSRTAAFLTLPTQTTIPIRNRENVGSKDLRSADRLPPAEVQAALKKLVEEHIGMQRPELINTTARILGFKVTAGELKELISTQIDSLLSKSEIQERDSKLFPSEK